MLYNLNIKKLGGIHMEKKEKLNKWLQLYFEDCEYRRRLNKATIKAYKIDLKQYASYVGQDYENYKKISDFIHYINQKYSKPKTVKRKIASVKAFYSYLEYEELIKDSPFRKIRTQIKEPLILPKTIDSTIIDKIFQYLYAQIKKAKSDTELMVNIRNTAIIELLFSTGIRISELCNIKKDSINLNDGTLKIFGKGSKERILTIGNQDVLNILTRYENLYYQDIEKSGYFFVNRFSKRLSEQSVRILLNKMEYELSLPIHITPHMYRHTFATMLLEKDVDIRYIQKILGHSSISVTQIYTHVTNVKQREILINKNPRNNYNSYS